jgi:hypothetical protein
VKRFLQSILRLVPSQKQYQDWKLPSKHSWISVLIGIVCLVLALLIPLLISVFQAPATEQDVDRILRENLKKWTPYLDDRFPRGYAVFGISEKGFIVPKGTVKQGITIDWKDAKVTDVNETHVNFLLPAVHYDGIVIGNKMEMGVPKQIGEMVPCLGLNDVRLLCGVTGIYNNLVVVALAFEEREVDW